MARKIKFALEMKDGVEVRRNLEELREHFDMEKVVGHFLSGKLVKWLEDRYYDDEVAKINQINKDVPNFHRQLCTALGVEYTGGEDLDVEQLERLNEKRRILQEMTDDEEIIAHAAETALNQEDLADLLDMDTPTIYLCGKNFNVPIRVASKKYVGILGTPNVSINATSQADTDAKKIFFENVRLPWSVEEKIPEDNFTVILGNNDHVSEKETPNQPIPVEEPVPSVDELTVAVNKVLGSINEGYLTDWVGIAPILFVNDYGAEGKSGIKDAIRSAAAEYEDEMRDGFIQGMDNRLNILQELQERYDEVFQTFGLKYLPLSPSLQEISEMMSRNRQSLLSACSGLTSILPSRARFNTNLQ